MKKKKISQIFYFQKFYFPNKIRRIIILEIMNKYI